MEVKKDRGFYIYSGANMRCITYVAFINKFPLISFGDPYTTENAFLLKTENEAKNLIKKIQKADEDLGCYLKFGDFKGRGMTGYSHERAIKDAVKFIKSPVKQIHKDKYEEDLMEYGKWLDKNYESVFHFGLFTKMVNKEWSKKDILRVLNSFKDKL